MSELTPKDNMLLESLQDLCDECKQAIHDEDEGALKDTMNEVCERCQAVRKHIPELMELRAKVEDFNHHLKGRS